MTVHLLATKLNFPPTHPYFVPRTRLIELITSQFYFQVDQEQVEGEGMFIQVGESGDLLLLTLVTLTDGNGNPVMIAYKDMVIQTGGGGTLPPTPSQGEGPYYPLADVSAFEERDQLFGEVDHGVKEDHRQRTALDGRGIKAPGYRRRVVHLPANCSGEKKDLTSGRLAKLACRFHQLYNQSDQFSPSATLVVK